MADSSRRLVSGTGLIMGGPVIKPAEPVVHQVVSSSVVSSNETFDDELLHHMKNFIKWIGTLEPVKKKPFILNELNNYATKSQLGAFRAWFLTCVKPYMGDVYDVTQTLLLNYQLLPVDFKKEDLEKFGVYLQCFECYTE